MDSSSAAPEVITVLDPRSSPDVAEAHMTRLASMQQRTVGLLWNNRPRGDIVLRGIEQRLHSDFDARTVFVSKLRVGSGAPMDLIQRLEKEVEAVIVGVGD